MEAASVVRVVENVASDVPNAVVFAQTVVLDKQSVVRVVQISTKCCNG